MKAIKEIISNPDVAWPDELECVIESDLAVIAKYLPQEHSRADRIEVAEQIRSYCSFLKKVRELRGKGKNDRAIRVEDLTDHSYNQIPSWAKWKTEDKS